MKIVVLLKQVPDTYGDRKLNLTSGWADRDASESVVDEIDERALEVALSYADTNRDAEIVVLTMGPDSALDAVRRGLAMGAHSGVHVVDSSLAGADIARTAFVLSAALNATGFDLVIAGNESTDGRGGVVPAMVAEHLGIPHVTYVSSVAVEGGSISGLRSIEGGSITVTADLPAVISVTEQNPEGRFPKLKGIMTAKRKPVRTIGLAELSLSPTPAGVGNSVVLDAHERPVRGAGIKDADAEGAADRLVEFLASRRLV